MNLIPGIPKSALLQLENPAQYLGGEFGAVLEDKEGARCHICLAFPDTYQIGMSHLGLQLLYRILNAQPWIRAERAFAPLADMEELLRRRGLPLRSLESHRPLAEFAVVGFSLQYELCCTQVLNMLDLSGITPWAADRSSGEPLLIAGGPVAYHPEPIAPFFDAILIGDAEELILEFMELVDQARQSGQSRRELLRAAAGLPGVYVPQLYQAEPGSARIVPIGHEQWTISARKLSSLETGFQPEAPLIPNVKAVHDRLAVEVMRGCLRGCRFCQAGFTQRPQRERSPQGVQEIITRGLKGTGWEEAALLSLSTADYSGLLPLLSHLGDSLQGRPDIRISLPSSRADAMTLQLLQQLTNFRRAGFTIAPEAGSQRLRDVLNKNLTEEQILESCRLAFELGWNGVKLYFMLGLPTETDADLAGIADIIAQVKKLARGRKTVSASIATFIPKPHTPFQWAEQVAPSEINRRQQLLRDLLRRSRVSISFPAAAGALLEGILARGGRTLAPVIQRAFALGCRFDSWRDQLNFPNWQQALAEQGWDQPEELLQARQLSQPLPWDHIDSGVSKDFLAAEWQRSERGESTPSCNQGDCSACGVCSPAGLQNIILSSPAAVALPTPPRARSAQIAQQRFRLQYGKRGAFTLVPHLQLTAVFFRALRRAEIPVALSQGFSPLPRLGFGPPLQLGIASNCEFVDIFLTKRLPVTELLARLAAELPPGLPPVAIQEIDLKAGSIQSSLAEQHYTLGLATEEGNVVFDAVWPPTLADWPDFELLRSRHGGSQTVRLGTFVSWVKSTETALLFALKQLEGGVSLKPSEVTVALTKIAADKLDITKTAVRWQEELP